MTTCSKPTGKLDGAKHIDDNKGMRIEIVFSLLFAAASPAGAHSSHRSMGPFDCGDMEVWDYGMQMCNPRAMAGMPMKMAMLDANAFLVGLSQEGTRARNRVAAPNMIMADIGSSVGDSQYLNVDLMTTFERWTFPKEGYPLYLQIGEENEDHQPYVDAQHPHSSPIMGLTFSDTISLGDGKDFLKVFFAPRGEATEGPIAFMHRPTGAVNPNAPLGHHLGQDAGHITSTVLGASWGRGENRLEASVFNGTEPEPAKVDLPMSTLNSYAVRGILSLSPAWTAMASGAYVKDPEPHDPDLDHVSRYSASLYYQTPEAGKTMFHNALIFGQVENYDHTSVLQSFAEEFLYHADSHKYWARFEVLQRTAAELAIATADLTKPRWVQAATVGYTYDFWSWEGVQFGAGAAASKNFLPEEFRDAYGGEPLSAQVFLQASTQKMWEF